MSKLNDYLKQINIPLNESEININQKEIEKFLKLLNRFKKYSKISLSKAIREFSFENDISLKDADISHLIDIIIKE